MKKLNYKLYVEHIGKTWYACFYDHLKKYYLSLVT
jgi:hypothetical protein